MAGKSLPKIVILLAEKDGNYTRVDECYSKYVIAAGGIPVHLTPELIDMQLAAVNPRGLILPGGDFPFPDEYYIDKPFYPGKAGIRFDAYREMINYSVAHHIPLLGICAGMQAMAGYLGGKIGNPAKGHRVEDEYAHNVAICPDSLLMKIVAAHSIMVNSSHNEFVAAVGKFGTAAISDDGIIEAIEPRSPWADFVLGVQWHPEKLAEKDERQAAIFNAFVKAAKHR
ncbi:MAG: gamma-glutamyl-gamma-aminobutyrate hydrolase family protein [Rickettsiales bacterium]|nr:gamma-glutamyl-gamma-aminobutyrate hydrolase family protein [Rickettsiales bacterium]